MEDVELVIKIPEEKYQDILNMAEEILDAGTFCSPRYLYKAVLNGTPLPKGHGRLIDADAELKGLRKMKVVDKKDKQSVRFAIINYENALTIIEADKAENKEHGHMTADELAELFTENERDNVMGSYTGFLRYIDIFNNFCKKYPDIEVKDFRPAIEQYIPQLSRDIPNAIIVWLKDGSKMIYIAESEE